MSLNIFEDPQEFYFSDEESDDEYDFGFEVDYDYVETQPQRHNFYQNVKVRDFGSLATEQAEAEKDRIEEAHYRKQKDDYLLSRSITEEKVRETIFNGQQVFGLLTGVELKFDEIEGVQIRKFEPTEETKSKINVFNKVMTNESKKYEMILKELDNYERIEKVNLEKICTDPSFQSKLKLNDVVPISTIQKEIALHGDQYFRIKKRSKGKGSFKFPNRDLDQPLEAEVASVSRVEEKIHLPEAESGYGNHNFDKYDENWFNSLTKERYNYLIAKYRIAYYQDNANFKFKLKKGLNIAFIPSGGGKTTLSKQFGKFIFDIDDLLTYESNAEQIMFIMNYCRAKQDWRAINNYWKTMIYNYQDLINGRILMCHSPDQIPKDLLFKSECVVIFPKKKRKGLRLFNENMQHLLSLPTFYKYEVENKYMFYFMYQYFKKFSKINLR